MPTGRGTVLPADQSTPRLALSGAVSPGALSSAVDEPSGAPISHPGPRVDHELVSQICGHLRAELGPGFDQVIEPALDGLLGRSSR